MVFPVPRTGKGRKGKLTMTIKTLAADFGKGLFAGFAGTLAITASQTVEMKLRHRPPSSSPADAAGKVLGVAPTGEAEKQRFSRIVHFGYDTAWGGLRGVLDALGLSPTAATAVHFAAVSGAAMLMLPGLKVAPPVREWGAGEIAVETLHHLIYALATGAAYEKISAQKE